MAFEVDILYAIVHTMKCDRCPFQCEDNPFRTYENCTKRWGEILSKIDPNVNWTEVREELYNKWRKENYWSEN